MSNMIILRRWSTSWHHLLKHLTKWVNDFVILTMSNKAQWDTEAFNTELISCKMNYWQNMLAAQVKLNQMTMSVWYRPAISQRHHGQWLSVAWLTGSSCKWVHLSAMCAPDNRIAFFSFLSFQSQKEWQHLLTFIFYFAQICSRSYLLTITQMVLLHSGLFLVTLHDSESIL